MRPLQLIQASFDLPVAILFCSLSPRIKLLLRGECLRGIRSILPSDRQQLLISERSEISPVLGDCLGGGVSGVHLILPNGSDEGRRNE